MFGNTFYNKITKKYVSIFGTLFNDIKLIREDINNVSSEYIIPITFSPRQKFSAVLEQDMRKDSQSIIFPVMGFEILSIYYDAERKIAPSIPLTLSSTATEKVILQNPVPYNIDFQLNIATKHLEDQYRIVEQILPVFSPTFTVSAKLIDNHTEYTDLPITLTSVNFEDGYEGNVETRRPIIWSLTFTLKGFYYGSSSSKKIIKFVQANLYSSLIANTAVENITVQPGSTAANVATIDVNLSRPWIEISESDNWDYIINIENN